MFPLATGVFGLIVGSFLNVVILRFGTHSLRGRSVCMSCRRRLEWFELVPILSWIALRGKCRSCRTAISAQYPFVELSTALLFAFLAGAFEAGLRQGQPLAIVLFPASLAIASLLIAIGVYDLWHTIIPDPWVYAFAALALLAQILALPSNTGLLLALAAGPIAASPTFVLWFLTRGRGMGFGDVKLSLGIGWLLGPFAGIFAVFGAFVIGGFVSIPLLVLSSKWWNRMVAGFIQPHSSVWGQLLSSKSGAGYTMKSEVAFGPFLVVATLCVWILLLYGIDFPLVI